MNDKVLYMFTYVSKSMDNEWQDVSYSMQLYSIASIS